MPAPAFAAPVALPSSRTRLPQSSLALSRLPPAPRPHLSSRTASARLIPARVARVASVVAGAVGGSLLAALSTRAGRPAVAPRPAVAAEMLEVPIRRASGGLDLSMLGIKTEEFVGHKELFKLKTTQFSEAEEEIMELNEDEVDNKWFYDLQVMWAGLGSVVGIFALYKGGVLWEKWIQEQERKDMEEEIELTGQFIDPRAVRKPEDEDDGGKGKGKKGGDKPSGGDDGEGPPETDDLPPGGIDALEKLFGKS